MTKTIILDGSETKVEGLGDRNTLIVNNSSSTIYASANSGVEAFADNVIAIKAGQRDIIPETHGTVYLLGIGNVECRGVRYVNFNQPSLSNDGGGGNDVTKTYVDNQDAITLKTSKSYTDNKNTVLTSTELQELLFSVYNDDKLI